MAERHQPSSERPYYLSSLLLRSWAERIASSIIQIVSNAIKPIIYSWQLLILVPFLFPLYSIIAFLRLCLYRRLQILHFSSKFNKQNVGYIFRRTISL